MNFEKLRATLPAAAAVAVFYEWLFHFFALINRKLSRLFSSFTSPPPPLLLSSMINIAVNKDSFIHHHRHHPITHVLYIVHFSICARLSSVSLFYVFVLIEETFISLLAFSIGILRIKGIQTNESRITRQAAAGNDYRNASSTLLFHFSVGRRNDGYFLATTSNSFGQDPSRGEETRE